MPTRIRRRTPLVALIVPLVLLSVAAYFGWQSTRGVFSQEARQVLAGERAERQGELDRLVARREELEAKVAGLRTNALDADLLDERARAQLNMARPNEIVIFHRRPSERLAARH